MERAAGNATNARVDADLVRSDGGAACEHRQGKQGEHREVTVTATDGLARMTRPDLEASRPIRALSPAQC